MDFKCGINGTSLIESLKLWDMDTRRVYHALGSATRRLASYVFICTHESESVLIKVRFHKEVCTSLSLAVQCSLLSTVQSSYCCRNSPGSCASFSLGGVSYKAFNFFFHRLIDTMALNPPLLIAQQVFSLLSGVSSSTSPQASSSSSSSSCPPSSNSTTTTTAPDASQAQIPKDLPSLLTFLFSLSAIRDYTKLLLIGSLLESLRRIIMSVYRRLYDSFFISAHFEEYDAPYEWMMHWLAEREEWSELPLSSCCLIY